MLDKELASRSLLLKLTNFYANKSLTNDICEFMLPTDSNEKQNGIYWFEYLYVSVKIFIFHFYKFFSFSSGL